MGRGTQAKSDGKGIESPMLVVVYRLFGHYSFNARDGGVRQTLSLAAGYSIGQWLDGSRLLVGPGGRFSIEQAIYHGVAHVVDET